MAVSTFQLDLNVFELLPVEPSSIAEKGQLTKQSNSLTKIMSCVESCLHYNQNHPP